MWQHLDALRELLTPVTSAVEELCTGEPTACLRVVRQFEASWREADLGFHLDREWVQLLSRTGASIDVDEYDHGSWAPRTLESLRALPARGR